MVDGIWWYSVTWCDGDKTVEPRINLEGAEDMVVEFEKEWAEWEAANAKPAHGGRVARKAGAGALPLGVAGAGAGEPSELQQAMVMMAQSVSAMVQCQAEAKASAGSSAATDGKLPGMRDLMGGSKRLKEVGRRRPGGGALHTGAGFEAGEGASAGDDAAESTLRRQV